MGTGSGVYGHRTLVDDLLAKYKKLFHETKKICAIGPNILIGTYPTVTAVC